MSVWRGRPLVLAGGISDSNRAHCASVRSLGNPLPDCLCASRCSLVHIPNHLLPILAETVNHAAVDNSRNFWVRLLVIIPPVQIAVTLSAFAFPHCDRPHASLGIFLQDRGIFRAASVRGFNLGEAG